MPPQHADAHPADAHPADAHPAATRHAEQGGAIRTARIVIIGAGFSGIGMAIRLRQRGITDFVILERADALGGTWRDNSYPGCACDVQSTLYSFSFAPNPEWSSTFAPQPEIWAYLRRCVQTFDIGRHIVFGQNITGAAWHDDAQRWTVTTTTHTWHATIMVAANGPLSDPITPSLAGLDTFRGPAFHSAQWQHDVDLRGKHVAVIGTGASAIQFVPHIQPLVKQLDIYQRTPPWIMPRHDRAVPAWRHRLYRTLPFTQRAHRAALYALRELSFVPFRHPRIAHAAQRLATRHLHAQVRDTTLRAQLTPSYTIGCKRILLSDTYYPALTQPNVALITDRIAHIGADRIVTDHVASDHGAQRTHTPRRADVIIFGTGFRATDPPLAPCITGRDGRSLAESWQGSPKAYMGTTEAGFPNLFFLLGPNTGLGHNSVLLIVEAQIEHVLGVLALMDERHAGAIEPTEAAQRAYVQWIDERLAATVWNRGGCHSWYLDDTGRNSTLWPERVGRFRHTVARVRADDYRSMPRVGA